MDDWLLSNGRSSADPFMQTLMCSIGVDLHETKGRLNRINTTEEIEAASELKSELGRQTTESLVEDCPNDGPWDEKFFSVLEQLLADHVQFINADGELH